MNADLFAMLGGAGGGSAASEPRRDDGKVILTLKAGKMKSEQQDNGKFLMSPIKTRGEIQLKWQANHCQLKLEWKERRGNAKDCERTVTATSTSAPTFQKIGSDRVYMLQIGDDRLFFWLQDKDTSHDTELVAKLNHFLTDLKACATEAGDAAGVVSLRSTTTADTSQTSSAAASGQVDALSSILENLGIPAPTSPATAAGGLTLSDLQGAMAGLGTSSPNIMENAPTKEKLLSLLAAGQQTEEVLVEQLQSPQVQESIQRVTAALTEDGPSLQEAIVNFEPESNSEENPIQAFFDALLASLQKDDAGESKEDK